MMDGQHARWPDMSQNCPSDHFWPSWSPHKMGTCRPRAARAARINTAVSWHECLLARIDRARRRGSFYKLAMVRVTKYIYNYMWFSDPYRITAFFNEWPFFPCFFPLKIYIKVYGGIAHYWNPPKLSCVFLCVRSDARSAPGCRRSSGCGV